MKQHAKNKAEPAAQERTPAAAVNDALTAPPALQRLQRIADESPRTAQMKRLATMTGARGDLPGQLRSGIESLSGMDLSDVRVHRQSDKPAQLNALAYAQGSDIYLGPGQEQHLPHEAWHVVQQRQGRVAETVQVAGVGVNDDPGLEQEADRMGAQAVHADVPAEPDGVPAAPGSVVQSVAGGTAPVQRVETPLDFDEHRAELEAVATQIEGLEMDGADTLEEVIPGSDVWASETRNAAARKYAEFNTAVHYLNPDDEGAVDVGHGVRFGTHTTLLADVEMDGHDEAGGELLTVLESKYVTGGWPQFGVNVLAARRQCALRTPGYGYAQGIAEIHLTQDFLAAASATLGSFQAVVDACEAYLGGGMRTIIPSAPGAQFFVRLVLPNGQSEQYNVTDLHEEGEANVDYPER